jgi:hypothetical protein
VCKGFLTNTKENIYKGEIFTRGKIFIKEYIYKGGKSW